MNSGHDDIRELLPEYLNGLLSGSARRRIEAHIEKCRDCRDEFSLLSDLTSTGVPDPGEDFWKALPHKATMHSRNRRRRDRFHLKSLLLRPLPAAAAAAALLFIVSFAYMIAKESPGSPPATAPTTTAAIDSGDVVTPIAGLPAGDDLEFELAALPKDSYYEEIASLSAEELDSLYEALENEELKGG